MITVVSGNPRDDSRTVRLAAAVGRELASRLGEPEPRLVDLAPLGYRLLVAGDVTRKRSLAAIEEADLVVVATPTYKGSYTGILKVLLDALPHDGLAGKRAVPLVTAGTATQADSTVAKLVDLLAELGATVITPALAVTEAALTDLDALAATLAESISERLTPQSA